ncbi:hypothetical protein [Neobacillus niacini]
METIKSVHYTRYPVVDGDKDHILGFINVKELLTALQDTNMIRTLI